MSDKSTIHDIASLLNITASTVSRALNDHPKISDATKHKVIEAAKKLKYQPNTIAAALRNGRTKVVGVLVPTIDRHYFASVIHSMEEVLNAAGYQVIVAQTNDSPEIEKTKLNTLLNAQVAGIVASFAKHNTTFEHYQDVIASGIPLILFDRYHDSLDIDTVVIDDYMGAFKATEHLIEQGCQRIVHFTSTSQISIYKERKRGYLDALIANNVTLDESLIWESGLSLEDGMTLGRKLLSEHKKVDAVFSSSDFAAIGAMQEIKKSKDKDISGIKFFGFSNETLSQFIDPPLSSVDQLSMTTGKISANRLLERINHNNTQALPTQKTVLTPKLCIRASSNG